MVHRIVWRVGSETALDFWADRLAGEGVAVERTPGSVRFADPEGLALELVASSATDTPLLADAPDVPAEHALQGFEAVRAYAAHPDASRSVLEDVLGFRSRGDGAWEARGSERGGTIHYDASPGRGLGGAGTVHHVAWAIRLDEQDAWQAKVQEAGLGPTPVIDRFYFRSIYFREPSGVLFELATMGPGFSVDEDAEHLGERLSLPPAFEALRAQVEPALTPLPDPRAAFRSRRGA
jgi:glyoxalase family protein